MFEAMAQFLKCSFLFVINFVTDAEVPSKCLLNKKLFIKKVRSSCIHFAPGKKDLSNHSL